MVAAQPGVSTAPAPPNRGLSHSEGQLQPLSTLMAPQQWEHPPASPQIQENSGLWGACRPAHLEYTGSSHDGATGKAGSGNPNRYPVAMPWAQDSLSLYPRDDGAEGRLHVRRGARAHHGQCVPLQDVGEELGSKGARWAAVSPTPPGPAGGCHPTCPCQSAVLTRMIFSGSWSSETRMWFSWSYTVFLGICRHRSIHTEGRGAAPQAPQQLPRVGRTQLWTEATG